MIRQLFNMLWRKKKSNFLLVFQLFISFLAMSLFIAINIEKFSDYFRPYYYNYQDIWGISVSTDGIPKEKAAEYLSFVKQRLKEIPGTEAVSNGNLLPFGSFGTPGKGNIQGQKISVKSFRVDENCLNVLQLPLLKGRWFSKEDHTSVIIPVVITRDFSEKHFKDQDPIGKTFILGEREVRVSGVSEVYRDNYSNVLTVNAKGYIFQPLPPDAVEGEFLLRSKQANDFLLMEERVRKALSSIKDEKFFVQQSAPVTMIKKQSTKMDLIQLTVALLVFAFLVLNIFLGISGVFSYAISKRKPEIGLRVATGASSGNILKQFLGETIILTSFAVIPGVIIAFQFFITVFSRTISIGEGLAGIVGSALFIYLLMIACCLYPSLKASKIQPAEALHEE